MKKQNLTVPLLMTASLASVITLNLSCGKKTAAPGDHWDTPGATPTNSAAENASVSNSAATSSSTPATTAVSVISAEITNSPVATTTAPTTPATPEPAPTAPAEKPVVKVVEMPATVPVAPEKFYSDDLTNQHRCFFANNPDYYFALRAGYEHANHGDNNDTWYAGIKFYAHTDALRAHAGKNGWLIPDADAEFSHQDLAKPDYNAHSGSGEGLQFRANFFWPWFNWTTGVLSRENCACPYGQPLHFSLGPTVNVGFDKVFDGGQTEPARYAGVRLTFLRDSFIEYTLGDTDGLDGTRQQALAELPFSISRDNQVRYVFRGLWNRGDHSKSDLLQAGIFLEMPLELLAKPREWNDLIPFVK